MNSPHLSDDQIAAFLAGDRPVALTAHAEACASCAARLGSFLTAVSTLRHGLDYHAGNRPVPRFRPAVSVWSPASRWACAGAMAALLAAVPIYRNQARPQAPPPSVLVASGVSDAVLFDEMNVQLSRGVPNAMEPLAALVWAPNQLEPKRKSE